MKLNRRETFIFLAGLIIGSAIIFLITNHKIASQKSLTKRILNNSIQSMKASQDLASSCSEAYNTATACVSNLHSCNIKEETKKLDEYNTRRKHADTIIDWANQDMKQIIEEVSTNR